MYGFFLYMLLRGIFSSGWGPKYWRGSLACPQCDPSRMAVVYPLIAEVMAQHNFDRLDCGFPYMLYAFCILVLICLQPELFFILM